MLLDACQLEWSRDPVEYYVHPQIPSKEEDFDYRVLIKDNWQTDTWGFPDISYIVEAHFRHGPKATQDMVRKMRPWCVVCKYPGDVVLGE
jgi:hypothetical protein